MAYIALYRKYRPLTFTDVVGQHQVSDTLMRAIQEDKVAHAYLFAGPRGTGKTSMAKIFARAINCEHGPTDHPCNQCRVCQQILAGDSMDVFEIDAASNRGIDEIRSLRENVKFMPVEGRKKIYIIDEAHMLTTEAWNALLKTIEEPPAHIMFIFATTEAEKLPVTILSRCQRYTFRRITADDIAGRLQYVAEQEHIPLDPGAAQLIAVHADGGLRDALSILDQCAGMARGTITAHVVEEMVGLVSKEWIIQFFESLRQGDGAAILERIHQALAEGRDSVQILDAFIQHMRAMIVAKVMPEADEIKIYDSYRDAFLKQSQELDMETLNYYIRSLQTIQNDAKQVDNPRTIVEMGLLMLCARINRDVDSLESRLTLLENQQERTDEGVLNRLAKLEAGQVVPPSDSYLGSASVPSPMQTSYGKDLHSNPEKTVVPTGNTMPTSPIGMPNVGPVGMVPPPKPGGLHKPAVGMTPPPSSKPLPKVGGKTLPPPKPESAPAMKQAPSTLRVSSSGGEAHIGTDMIRPDEYRNIHGKVLQWMQGHKKGMAAGLYKSGQVVYVDRSRVVVAFNTDFNITIASGASILDDAQQAFSAILEFPVLIEVIGAGTPEYSAYREAANQELARIKGMQAGQKAAPSPQKLPSQPQKVTSESQQAEVASPETVETDTLIDEPPSAFAAAAKAMQEQMAQSGSRRTQDAMKRVQSMSSQERGASPAGGDFPRQVEDGFNVDGLEAWHLDSMTEEEKSNPLLVETLKSFADSYDIYKEYIDDSEEEK